MINQLEAILNLIPEPKTEDSANKKPLLIIDDNQDVIDALKVILSSGYDLLTCTSYEEILQKNIEPCQVVLLDIKMAYKDGIEIFSLLKKMNPEMKIIFHSAYPGNDTQSRLAELLPHSGYLTKGDYDMQDLLTTIKNAF